MKEQSELFVEQQQQRGMARQCLDWTERKHHLAGPLGVELLALLCARRWLRRSDGARVIQLPSGNVPTISL